MGGGISRNEGPNGFLGNPFGKVPPQDTFSAFSFARNHQYAFKISVGSADYGFHKSRSSRHLSEVVQVNRRVDVNAAAPCPLILINRPQGRLQSYQSRNKYPREARRVWLCPYLALRAKYLALYPGNPPLPWAI